jgi:5-methylcytosine-specific restriction protein A
MFDIGREYKRTDLHDQFGGQRQSGIVTPRTHPLVLAFTGGGESHGYADEWRDGVFMYSGEGQLGDMTFTGGNKAIRDHVANGKELHLFTRTRKGFVRYEGEFTCTTWEYAPARDNTGKMRQAIVFHLTPADAAAELEPPTAKKPGVSLGELRKRALAATASAEQSDPRQARRNYYERSQAVRDYVLARAKGACESCGVPAPFSRKDGSPYLEPHHVRRLSDGGPDHPRFVGGVCPTCHRRVHYGADGAALNAALEKKLASLEA